ncbi:sulfatase-like hydrolase/transferase [Pontiella sulfatireligans]|uniref:Choline-sulfatase n=1 Tax=Pontiella sulfatireligans TaxID=2750658 RepID=A0A6C2US83_9BACT|nr:sulfatase-like hydrolase/transferase [Pontiella sulfatireligans]SPS74488.1 sulfatase S1_7 [Kiritimatiellales bacterium]VGO22114.1 Choline-sulfatase [Pontiella sulfatireligans]
MMKLSLRFLIPMAGIIVAGSCMAEPAAPNILFIMIDDLRPQLGCYGHDETVSPNIDRLAEQGVVFDRAYVQVPVCGASRASLLTGLYPTADRFVTYYTRAQEDAAGIPDIPTHFKSNGYTTISSGKIYHHADDNTNSWHEIHRPNDFRVYLKPENQDKEWAEMTAYEDADVPDNAYPGGALAEKVIGDIRRAKEEGTPFFITAGFTKPHLPFNAPKKYWDMYDPEKLELADNPFVPKGAPSNAIHQWNELRDGYGGMPTNGPVSDATARKLIHGYYACVSYTDAMVGKLLDELERLELRDDTIVILMGDHGWQLGEHGLWCKHALFNTSTYTPLMISAPGFNKGKRTDALVEFVDIYPSLCELAGLPMPEHLQGKSFVPLLGQPSMDWKTAAFSRYHGGENVVTERYSYSEWTDGSRMLYDHKKDPDENINVSENPEYAPIVEKLARRLERHNEAVTARDITSGLGTINNEPPVWKSQTFQQKEATAGQPYMTYINWRVSDVDADELVFAKISGPAWLSIANANYGRIEGTPSAGDIGMNVFAVSVSDGTNEPVKATMELNVLPAP